MMFIIIKAGPMMHLALVLDESLRGQEKTEGNGASLIGEGWRERRIAQSPRTS